MTSDAIPTRDAIIATAHESIARGSKSFATASLLFDRATRERAWLLYAWCRACDDIADGQDHGHDLRVVEDAPQRIAAMAALTDAALAGQVIGEPAFDALRIVAAETRLPHRFAHDLIQGFRLDGDGWRPWSEDDLLTYCYHVAGIVGCMMAVVMGVSPEDEAVLDRACDLGMAFQLANIARDVDEDARGGRCYLPGAWLAEMGIATDAVMAPEHRGALAVLARRLTDRAAQFEASAWIGTRALSFRSAWAVLAAARIYGTIGRKVAARGAAAWNSRVSTSKTEKIGFIARAAFEARGRHELIEVSRDPDLWTRPRA
ncbi:phytoene/squalene synthase family protein [Sphingomonas sp. RP10(2022)]|uniref:Phytoene/squalene synthase family protein n=1 Tax=Sphingomonas liriopis TaxID=2949094 RepID=A0A9X2KRV7_9SPHN|nr:phytoene/squalene synthase family protein [Sphingomonas liriopis]MCP3736046.1 phytoene/squalene synthase family protein [Sphingomonas liriopis]